MLIKNIRNFGHLKSINVSIHDAPVNHNGFGLNIFYSEKNIYSIIAFAYNINETDQNESNCLLSFSPTTVLPKI